MAFFLAKIFLRTILEDNYLLILALLLNSRFDFRTLDIRSTDFAVLPADHKYFVKGNRIALFRLELLNEDDAAF